MSGSTVEHFSHPQHPLALKQDVVIGADDTCSVCNQPVLGSPTYTCSSDDIHCQKFYLHKSCAELPKQIIRYKQDEHPLALLPRPDGCTCDVCGSRVDFPYACIYCNFDVCVVCAFISVVPEERVIRHDGHGEHALTLQRQALFRCDACWEEAKDYSYVCLTCDFWIHKECAFSPPIIPAPTYHHHPLNLIFSVPVMHRCFIRKCAVCDEPVQVPCWSYYCHKCTFFVHMKCSTSTISLVYSTNGFYYECETCDIRFDIRCVFLPGRIRHKSHKHHCLVQSPPSISNTVCSVSKVNITDRLQFKYACETCTNFHISIVCAFYPSRKKHGYDDHSLILRHPPFFYEGVFYCQLCEEKVNNQWWLYHCDECDQSFHFSCLRSHINVKVGGTVKHSIDNQPHTLALVLKQTRRNSSPPYLCGICGKGHTFQFFFECGGCGYLACIFCIRRIHGGE